LFRFCPKFKPNQLKICLLLLFLFGGEGAFSQIALNVSPPVLEVEVTGGGVRNFQIELINGGEEEIMVTLDLADFVLSPEGNTELKGKGETSFSLSEWIRVKQDKQTILKSGEKKKIGFELRVPRGERGARYGAVVFEALPRRIPQGKIALGIRTGSLIFLTIPRTEKIGGKVKEISIEKGKVTFQNTGNTHLEVEGSLLVKNSEGKIINRLRFPENPSLVLPQGERYFSIPWDKESLLPGIYLLEVRMSARRGRQLINLDRREIEFEVLEGGEK